MVMPTEMLPGSHAVLASLQATAGLRISDTGAVVVIGGVIVACGVETMRKTIRNLRGRRRQQAQLAAELDAFLVRLRQVLSQPARSDYSAAVDSAPRVAVEIRALLPHGVLAEHLLSWWRFNLPKRIPVFDALNAIIISHAMFDVAASRLDRALIEGISSYNREHKIDPLTDRLDLSFMLARILGQPEEILLAKLGLSGKPLDFLRVRCEAILHDPANEPFVHAYLESRKQLEASIARLRATLNVSADAKEMPALRHEPAA